MSKDTDSTSSGEGALLNRLQALVQTPRFLQEQFRSMTSDRKYVSTDCMLTKSQDTVAVNHVLRNQLLALAYQGTFDPQPFCQPQKQTGSVVSQTDEFFAETMEIFLSRQAALMNFGEVFEGGSQDASTNGYAIFKVTLQNDLMLDSIGRARFGDQQEQVARYTALKSRFEAAEFTEDDADYQTMMDTERALRVFYAGKIMEQIEAVPVMVEAPLLDPVTQAPIVDPATGQPVMQMVPDPQDPRELERKALIDGEEFDVYGQAEVEHYKGFKLDQILPEDFRWDWDVFRPEDLPESGWMGHRVYMRTEDIQPKFKLTAEELTQVRGIEGNSRRGTGGMGGGGGQRTNSDTDPSIRNDLENETLNDSIAVWEVWDKQSFTRYTFINGMSRFLAKETPTDVGRRFFPFFMLRYNRVSGQVQAVSDVRLVRQLQDEVNTLRSHDREMKRAAYPVIFIPKDLMDKAAKSNYANRHPASLIEVNNVEDINKYMKEATSVAYNPAVTDDSKAVNQMQQMFGLPLAVTGGGSGEQLASALALAKEGMETGVAWRRIQANRVITEIFHYMAEIGNKVFGLQTIQGWAGPLAVWPQLTVEELFVRLRIEVKGGMSGQPRAKDRLDLWTNFASIAQTLGLPVNGPEVLREILEALGIRKDFGRFIMPMPPMTVPQGGTVPGEAPNKGQGPDGGAPLMVDPQRGAPTELSQIPNHP